VVAQVPAAVVGQLPVGEAAAVVRRFPREEEMAVLIQVTEGEGEVQAAAVVVARQVPAKVERSLLVRQAREEISPTPPWDGAAFGRLKDRKEDSSLR